MGMGMGAEGSNPTGAGTLTVGCCCSAPYIGKGNRKGLGLGTAAVRDTLLSQPGSAGSWGGQPGSPRVWALVHATAPSLSSVV